MPIKKKKVFNLVQASQLPEREYLPTGIPELDKEIKGFPRKQITEIFALEKVGKTTLTLMAIAAITRAKKKVIFIDAENSFNKDRAKALGVDLSQLIIAKENILEDVAQLIMDNVASCEAIVIDSLPALIPKREAEGEFGDANVGVKAFILNSFMRRITPELDKSDCALICINQLRPNVAGGPYDPKYVIPGGWALRFSAALRLELKRNNSSDLITKQVNGEKMQVGHTIHCRVIKTKNGSYEGIVIDYKLMYEDSPIVPEASVAEPVKKPAAAKPKTTTRKKNVTTKRKTSRKPASKQQS
jgi:recombination protein RecA